MVSNTRINEGLLSIPIQVDWFDFFDTLSRWQIHQIIAADGDLEVKDSVRFWPLRILSILVWSICSHRYQERREQLEGFSTIFT